MRIFSRSSKVRKVPVGQVVHCRRRRVDSSFVRTLTREELEREWRSLSRARQEIDLDSPH